MKNTRDNNGFTLLEVLLAIIIIGVLAAIALPSYFSWVPNMHLKADARELHSAFMKAKGEAAKRNRLIAVTFDQPISGTPYAYVVYVDTNGNLRLDAGEIALMSVQQWSENVSLSAVTFANNGAGNPSIAFSPTTIPTDSGGVPASGSASLLSSKGRTLNVAVSPAGSVTIN